MWTIDDEMSSLRKKLTVLRLVTGTVEGGVVVPDVALPEGTRVTVSMEDLSRAQRRSSNERLFAQLAECDLP